MPCPAAASKQPLCCQFPPSLTYKMMCSLMHTHLAPQQFCTQGAPLPLLGEFVLLGQQLELHFSFVIVQQNTFIRLSLRRAFILCVVRKSVLYWPAASQVELIALHIAACSGASDTEYANAVVHGVATDCLIDTLSFNMQSKLPRHLP